MTRSATLPTTISSPSASGSCGYSGSASAWIADRQAVLEREPPVPGDVVGVRVRLEDAHDPHVVPRRLLEVLLDRVGGVDDDRLARVLVTDEVGGAAEIVVDELPEQHVAGRLTGCLGTCRSGYLFCRSVGPGGSPRC